MYLQTNIIDKKDSAILNLKKSSTKNISYMLYCYFSSAEYVNLHSIFYNAINEK